MKHQKTIIVEFNGLAGLGKTTVANSLKEELRKEGYCVIGWYRHNFFHSLRPMFAIPYSFSLYLKVRRYADSIEPFRKDRKYVHWVNHFVRMYRSIEKHSDADFSISDEGIIQFLVAMGLNDRFPHTDLLDDVVKKIKSMGVYFVRVDCESRVDISVDRIMSRLPKGMYYEKWPKDQLTNQLQAEADNFAYLRSVFSRVFPDQLTITIDTLYAPEENAIKIKEIITKIR